MGLRAINNPNSSFEDPYANTGTEASIEWQPPKWYGDRGCFGGGYTGSDQNVIGYVTISSTGDASDFGDLTQARQYISGASNKTRGLWMGGANWSASSPYNTAVIDAVSLASQGNAFDFGDNTSARRNAGQCANNTRALLAGGYTSARVNTIDYITVSSTGDATDFGDRTTIGQACAGVSNNTRGIWAGANTPSATNIIDYITIATTGNAADFGDLLSPTASSGSTGSSSNSIRGVFNSGDVPNNINTMSYTVISSGGGTSYFGDLSYVTRDGPFGGGDNTRGVLGGSAGGPSNMGDSPGKGVDYIDFITFATTG